MDRLVQLSCLAQIGEHFFDAGYRFCFEVCSAAVECHHQMRMLVINESVWQKLLDTLLFLMRSVCLNLQNC